MPYYAKEILNLNLGLRLVPYTRNGTHPLWRGYNADPSISVATLGELEKRLATDDWPYGFGVVLQYSNLVMVDIDLHDPDEKDGSLSWQYIVETYSTSDIEMFREEDEVSTWTLTTPGDGLHLFFSRPADFPPNFKKGVIGPGVEVIAWGATALPPTAKRQKVRGRWRTVGHYRWREIDDYAENLGTLEHPFLDWYTIIHLQPGEFRLAPLPEWLTMWAHTPKMPLFSKREYRAVKFRDRPRLLNTFDDSDLLA